MARTRGTLLQVRAAGAVLALMALLAIEPGKSPLAPPDSDSAADVSKHPPVVGGLRVAVEPGTGKKIPAPPLRLETLSPELREALQRSTAGLVVIRRADGSKYVNLGGRFMSGIAVRVGPGSANATCTTAPQPSATAQPGTSTSTRREEEM